MSCSVPWYRRAVNQSVKFGVLRRHSAEGPSGGHDTHVPVVIWDGGFVAQVVKLAAGSGDDPQAKSIQQERCSLSHSPAC